MLCSKRFLTKYQVTFGLSSLTYVYDTCYTFSGPPYDDKGEIDKADVTEVLIADEDNNQRDFNAFNYIENELNDKLEQAEVDRQKQK